MLPAALCAGVAVAALVVFVAPPRRRLGPRLDDYTVVARAKLGVGPGAASLAQRPPPAMGGAMVAVLRPMADALARRLGTLARTTDDAALALQLRHAGIDLSPRAFRQQQLALAAVGAVAGVSLGALLGAGLGASPTPVALALGAAGLVGGAVWRTAEVARRIRDRQAQTRAELFSICQILAICARATPSLLAITEHVARRTHGVVAGELREVLRWIAAGTPTEVAFAEAARLAAEPAAARLYRVMASAAESGGDIADALMVQSEDIRDAQREDIRRAATKRRGAMVAPMVLVLAPIMLLFVVAAFPRIILGIS